MDYADIERGGSISVVYLTKISADNSVSVYELMMDSITSIYLNPTRATNSISKIWLFEHKSPSPTSAGAWFIPENQATTWWTFPPWTGAMAYIWFKMNWMALSNNKNWQCRNNSFFMAEKVSIESFRLRAFLCLSIDQYLTDSAKKIKNWVS